ncbi:glycoside hydrolase family 88 protein [Oceaniferula spumae]
MYKKRALLPSLIVFATATCPLFAQEQEAPVKEAPAVTEPATPAFSSELNTKSILKVANAAADWQLANPYERKDWDWTEGALWTGLLAHAQTTGDEKYYQALLKVSDDLNYQLGPRHGFGDDHCVGQLHLWHYLRDELPHQIAPTREVMDHFVARPHDESLFWVNHVHMREWAWCDALYMSPATLAMLHAATGDEKYLRKMDTLWWKTSDYLYDVKSHLYWRDSKYFESKEANGEKVFWSRGNGWVFAGLCHVLQYMPHDHPTRPKYIKQFKEMAAKLKSIQQKDGSWHASLLDPESFPVPESSGTAFFTYGFLWGINNGILPAAEYKQPAIRGWQRLVRNVHADGKLGYVQPIGQDPKLVTYDESAVYGVGGFLLCAHELHKHLILSEAKSATFTANSPSSFPRLNEVIEMDWKKAASLVPSLTTKNAAVRDAVTGYFLPTQVVDNNGDGKPDTLLFKASFSPKESRQFQLLACGKDQPKHRNNMLLARFVPERKDDFVWENDRIAYRAYGPALAVENARGGIDVWTKSVRRSIANEWYKKDDYHTNNGTGLDGYKVGDTLGCGGLGYLDAKGKLHTSPVFATHKVLESGPLRLKFQLSYKPVEIGDAKVSEVRTITMLAGDHHFTVESSFKVEGDAKGIRPVCGLAVRKPTKRPSFESGHFMAYQDPIIAETEGPITTFLLNDDKGANKRPAKKNNLTEIIADDLSKPVRYEAGAVWQKVDAPSDNNVKLMLYRISHEKRHPIVVK